MHELLIFQEFDEFAEVYLPFVLGSLEAHLGSFFDVLGKCFEIAIVDPHEMVFEEIFMRV